MNPMTLCNCCKKDTSVVYTTHKQETMLSKIPTESRTYYCAPCYMKTYVNKN